MQTIKGGRQYRFHTCGRTLPYHCAIRLFLYKYKGKYAAEAYFQYVRVQLIPK